MSDSKTVTVDSEELNLDIANQQHDGMSLFVNQMNDVNSMRQTLLTFNKNDPNAAKRAIQNITVLRIYHQMSRIIRYTELMDKIEDKMYQSIGCYLDDADEMDPNTWATLLRMQDQLQRSMIESHKLLEPYLNADTFNLPVVEVENPQESFTNMIIDQESREKLRTSAQAIIAELQGVAENEKNES